MYASYGIFYIINNFQHESFLANLEKYIHQSATLGLVENNSKRGSEEKTNMKQGENLVNENGK